MLLRIMTFSILLASFKSDAQWNYYAFLPTPTGVPVTYHVLDADFISPQTGVYAYFANFSPSSGSGYYFQLTTDSAISWTQYSHLSGIGISFNRYFSVPKQGTIYSGISDPFQTEINKIANPGLSWTNCYAGPSAGGNIRAFHTTDTSYLYILNGLHLSKYKNGSVFNNIFNFSGFNPRGLFFIDEQIGFITGDSVFNSYTHTILKTSNGGVAWMNIFTDTAFNINKIFFSDSLTGFAVGDSGKICRTINGGITWIPVSTGFTTNFLTANFLNNNFGFVGGQNGVLLRTTDGGTTWSQDAIGTVDAIEKIIFTDDTTAMAISDDMVFITNLNGPTGLWMPHTAINSTLKIFPNPARDKFEIMLPDELQNGQNLNLVIYDQSGKLIRQQTFHSEGGSIAINPESLSKGVYYLIVRKGCFLYTGKVVID